MKYAFALMTLAWVLSTSAYLIEHEIHRGNHQDIVTYACRLACLWLITLAVAVLATANF